MYWYYWEKIDVDNSWDLELIMRNSKNVTSQAKTDTVA